METIIPLLLILGLALLANMAAASRNKSLIDLFDWALAIFNIPLLLLGILLLIIPPEFVSSLVELELPDIDLDAAGWVLIAMAIWSILFCIRPLRRLLARLIPLNPE